ncbi:MAG: hypothetical protein ACOYOK_07665 [Pseudobdellovibrionaceae bacterium]
MKKIKDFFQSEFYKKHNYFIWGLVALSLYLCFQYLNVAASPEAKSTTDPEHNFSIDTVIPSGYSLVPIQLANAESLDSLLGPVGGVVDLYVNIEGGKSLKVASGLKMLRSPNNPMAYAVLVRRIESTQILNYTGPFTAVVQNPKESSSGVKQESKTNVQIQYQK